MKQLHTHTFPVTISYHTYISTGNFLSTIPVFDWSIFCYGNSILHQKKEMKVIKIQFFDEK